MLTPPGVSVNLPDDMEPETPDYVYDDSLVIPVDLHVGVEWDAKGEHYSAQPELHANGKRIAWFEVHSWVGVSVGAMHYYSAIKVHPYIVTGSGSIAGGHIPGLPDKSLSDTLRLDVYRKIKRGEKDGWGEPIGRPGEETSRFDTEDGATQAAIKLFKKKFGPGWVLVNHTSDHNGDHVILAET